MKVKIHFPPLPDTPPIALHGRKKLPKCEKCTKIEKMEEIRTQYDESAPKWEGKSTKNWRKLSKMKKGAQMTKKYPNVSEKNTPNG